MQAPNEETQPVRQDAIVIGPPVKRMMFSSMALLAIAAGGGGYLAPGCRREEIQEKPCLQCGKMKRHNNSFCSAECCRAHRANHATNDT